MVSTIKKYIVYLRLVGMSIITFGIITAIFPDIKIIPLEFSLGGIGIGGLLAWVVPFWLDPQTRKVLSNIFK